MSVNVCESLYSLKTNPMFLFGSFVRRSPYSPKEPETLNLPESVVSLHVSHSLFNLSCLQMLTISLTGLLQGSSTCWEDESIGLVCFHKEKIIWDGRGMQLSGWRASENADSSVEMNWEVMSAMSQTPGVPAGFLTGKQHSERAAIF